MKRLAIILALIALPCVAAPVPNASTPARLAPGHVITAAEWTAALTDVATFINNNVVSVFNLMTTKGDLLFSASPSSIGKLAVGTNTHIIYADSTQALGVKYAAATSQMVMTTKGDMQARNSTGMVRIPVGTNGQAFTCDSTADSGFSWQTFNSDWPKGAILAWSPTGATTTTIPTGWTVCDGTAGTPNLIGRFVIGTRPSSSGASPSSGGYGAQSVDSNGTGVSAHGQAFSLSGGVTSTQPNNLFTDGNQYGDPVTGSDLMGSNAHTHTVAASSATLDSSTVEPADYALIYLMKL